MTVRIIHTCDNCGATREDGVMTPNWHGWASVGVGGRYGWKVTLCPECLAIVPAIRLAAKRELA